MHDINMGMTDRVVGENGRVRTDSMAEKPTMMDNARMWPGGGWTEELKPKA
jgi:hypothetical protein